MGRVSRALVSVADKRGVADFVAALEALGIEVLSTGGTARALRHKGIRVADVESAIGFPELLGGRFKTLHPLTHCAILALRDRPDHMAELQQHGMQPIDLVAVNLQPFGAPAGADCPVDEAMETVDIGGAALLRSAAKNHRHVTAIADPDDYDRVLAALRRDGAVPPDLRAELALKAFRVAAAYDQAVAAYLAANIEGRFPSALILEFAKAQELRYGENPHQVAALYRDPRTREPSAGGATVLSGGKALSYNNLYDLDTALELLKEFEPPAAVVVQHANPWGLAVAADAAEAFARATAGAPPSGFGGVLAVNRAVDPATAERIADAAEGPQPHVFEVIAAPDYDEQALEILMHRPAWGADLRILRTAPWAPRRPDAKAYDLKRIVGGLLVQDRDLDLFGPDLRTVTQQKPSEDQQRDLHLAAACAKHTRSNAVALARDACLVGAGAGQASHLDAARLAIAKAGERARASALAADAFLPSPEVIEAAAQAGCTALIQPGGSEHDHLAIERADQYGLAMVFCGLRHFRH
ncbi:MAG: bifunctional phosphoribosylaminoimidazolecarboxamide formyltransferase/IMP cyclohydrolase [Candidatus Brocadiia bacterium]